MSKRIKEQYVEYEDEDEKISKLHLWEELGWQGTRAVMDALRAAK